MAAPKHPSAVILDEASQRSYEAIVQSRLPDVDAAAWSLFTFALGAGRRAEAFLADVVRRHDLDGAQLSVLLVLWFNGPPHRLSPTKLSRRIAQSPSGMTHTVKRLTAAGLVSRVGLETDGRAKHVELTADGERLVATCASELAKAVQDLFRQPGFAVEQMAASQREIMGLLTKAVSPAAD